MECSDSSTCTAIGDCVIGTFDSDKIPSNGCESIFDCNEIDVQNAVCRVCTSFVCTQISECSGKYDSDHDPSNGCESPFDCGTIFDNIGAQCTACSESICTAISSCDSGKYDSDHDPSNGCESEHNCEAIHVPQGKCIQCSDSSTCEKVTCNVHFFDRNAHHEDGCEVGPVVPHKRASKYNNEYGRFSQEWREMTFTDTMLSRDFCLLGSEAMCKNAITSIISVQVHHIPSNGVRGCEALISFYNQVRDALIPTLQTSIQTVANNVGSQGYINQLRDSIETAQIDAYNVNAYCNNLKNGLEIKRNMFHAYVQAWGKMKFQTPSRRLRASTN